MSPVFTHCALVPSDAELNGTSIRSTTSRNRCCSSGGIEPVGDCHITSPGASFVQPRPRARASSSHGLAGCGMRKIPAPRMTQPFLRTGKAEFRDKGEIGFPADRPSLVSSAHVVIGFEVSPRRGTAAGAGTTCCRDVAVGMAANRRDESSFVCGVPAGSPVRGMPGVEEGSGFRANQPSMVRGCCKRGMGVLSESSLPSSTAGHVFAVRSE